ncbi:MAG: ribosome recycling factor [Candidatus Saccharimonadales bacterium]
MVNDLTNQAKTEMQKAHEYLESELKTIRTNRASTALVEDIKVEHYGQQMPIKSLANISTPDAKTITITAWDATAVPVIEKALTQTEALGVTPLSDGKVIHLNIPPLTQERREQLVKQIGEKVENCYISMRNARHEALNQAKKGQNNKEITEDDYHLLQKQLDDFIEEYRQKVEAIAEAKKKEILVV